MNNTTLVVDPKPIYYKKSNFNSCLICFKSSKKGFDISLHAFPKNKDRRAIWLKKCGLVEEDIKHNRKLCCSHFKKDCIKTTGNRILLKKDAVPVIFDKEIKLKKTKKRSQIIEKRDVILNDVQLGYYNNSDGDLKPISGLNEFTHDSSDVILNDVQLGYYNNSDGDLKPISGLNEFTHDSSDVILNDVQLGYYNNSDGDLKPISGLNEFTHDSSDVILNDVQLGYYNNSDGDLKPISGLNEFTHDSSDVILNDVQLGYYNNSDGDLKPISGLNEFTHDSSENSLIELFGNVYWD